MRVHVVRNDSLRGTHIEQPPGTRERFRIKREYVYTRRKMLVYGLVWHAEPSLVGRRAVLQFGAVAATAQDLGIMSFCRVKVAGRGTQSRHPEEDTAGYGGFNRVLLRGTQHVIAIIEEHARLAAEVMDET